MNVPTWLDLKEFVTLLIGALLSSIGWLVNSWFTERRERRRVLWQRRMEVCRTVEETTGIVHDRLSGYDRRPELAAEVGKQLDDLRRFAGKLPRFPEVQQAVAAFHNTAGWILGNLDAAVAERQEHVAELTTHRDQVLAACSKALDT